MTQYIGIITAYGAVAVLAWLAVLLYPRLIPAAPRGFVENRRRHAGLFALALAAMAGLAVLAGRGFLLPADGPVPTAVNQCAIFAPIIAYALYLRRTAYVLVPEKNTLRSLAIGFGIAVLALTAYYSSTDGWSELAKLGGTILSADAITIVTRSVLRCLFVATLLTVIADGWSNRAALIVAGLAMVLVQMPALFEQGFSVGWLGLLVTHVALVIGLLSAILATRNIVWFWPVFLVLNLLQFSAFQDAA